MHGVGPYMRRIGLRLSDDAAPRRHGAGAGLAVFSRRRHPRRGGRDRFQWSEAARFVLLHPSAVRKRAVAGAGARALATLNGARIFSLNF